MIMRSVDVVPNEFGGDVLHGQDLPKARKHFTFEPPGCPKLLATAGMEDGVMGF